MVLHIFSYSINFVFRLMNFYLWISARYRIYFSPLLFFFEDRSFSDTDCKLNWDKNTLRSLLEIWGESNFSLNLLFSIIISKSISTFFPLWALITLRYYFSRLAYYIFILLYSLFFYIFFISSKWPPFFYPFIFE